MNPISEEPHAPRILHEDTTDVAGAYAGPFNEGEDLKLICQVHGGKQFLGLFFSASFCSAVISRLIIILRAVIISNKSV